MPLDMCTHFTPHVTARCWHYVTLLTLLGGRQAMRAATYLRLVYLPLDLHALYSTRYCTLLALCAITTLLGGRQALRAATYLRLVYLPETCTHFTTYLRLVYLPFDTHALYSTRYCTLLA
jgi:hypothetical protein